MNVFRCPDCPKFFHIERYLNVHMLFDHQTLKPECQNWKAIEQHELKMQRIIAHYKDLILEMEQYLKRQFSRDSGSSKEIFFSESWRYSYLYLDNEKMLNEIVELEYELAKEKQHIPKKSKLLTELISRYQRYYS